MPYVFPQGADARSALRELGKTLNKAKEEYTATRGAPNGHRAIQWAIIETALKDLTAPPAKGARSLPGMNLQTRETAFIGAICHVMMDIRKSYTGIVSGTLANVDNSELWGALNHLEVLHGMEEQDIKTALTGFYNYYKDHCINLGDRNPYKEPLKGHFDKFSQRVCRWVTGCDPVGLGSPSEFIADGKHEKKFDLKLIPMIIPTPKPEPKAEKPVETKEAKKGGSWMPGMPSLGLGGMFGSKDKSQVAKPVDEGLTASSSTVDGKPTVQEEEQANPFSMV